jgi:hypothetical protein
VPASLGTILAAGLAIAAAGALAATLVPELPDRVTSLPSVAATILPPLCFLPYMILTPPDVAPEPFPIVGLLAVVPGIGVPAAGAVLRNYRLRERATEHAVVTVGDDDDSILDSRGKSVLFVLAGIGGVMMIVGTALSVIADSMAGTSMLTSLGGLSSLLFLFTDDSTELAVTDAGLRVDRSMTPWDDLDGFRVTDDTIEIDRVRWWVLTRDFDRDEIDDDAALIEALAEFLPRTDVATETAVAAAE